MKNYYVYILTNRSGTLYTGVTNDLIRRLEEHREGKAGSFTGQYKLDRLVYFEDGNDIEGAILREKQIKGWTRAKKVTLIAAQNSHWTDLSEGWLDAGAGLPGGQILRSAQNDKAGAQNDKREVQNDKSRVLSDKSSARNDNASQAALAKEYCHV